MFTTRFGRLEELLLQKLTERDWKFGGFSDKIRVKSSETSSYLSEFMVVPSHPPPSALLLSGFRFRVSGFGFQATGFGFRGSGFGFRISGFGFRIPDFGCWVSDCGVVRISGFGFRGCSEIGLRISGLSGFGFRVLWFGLGAEAPGDQR